jgi:hypothetical protein
LKEIIAKLKETIKDNELKIVLTETRCKILEEETSRLSSVSNNLENKLVHETEALTKIRLQIMQLEETNTSSKLSYETQREQTELIKKENELLVSLLYNHP